MTDMTRITQDGRTYEVPAGLFVWDSISKCLRYAHNGEAVGSTPIDKAINIAIRAASRGGLKVPKLDAYRAGSYVIEGPIFSALPTSTANWDDQDWVRFIDSIDGWTVEVY